MPAKTYIYDSDAKAETKDRFIWTINPYLRHFENGMERHLWTKNPGKKLIFTRIIYAVIV